MNLTLKQTRPLWMGLLSGILLLILGGIILWLVTNFNRIPILAIVLILIFCVAGIGRIYKNGRDLADGMVTYQGAVGKGWFMKGSRKTYYVTIGEQRFEIRQPQWDELEKDRQYKIVYAKHSKKILMLEAM